MRDHIENKKCAGAESAEAVITFSTVGFGDMAPKSKLGRALGSLFMILGVASLGLLVAQAEFQSLQMFS